MSSDEEHEGHEERAILGRDRQPDAKEPEPDAAILENIRGQQEEHQGGHIGAPRPHGRTFTRGSRAWGRCPAHSSYG